MLRDLKATSWLIEGKSDEPVGVLGLVTCVIILSLWLDDLLLDEWDFLLFLLLLEEELPSFGDVMKAGAETSGTSITGAFLISGVFTYGTGSGFGSFVISGVAILTYGLGAGLGSIFFAFSISSN